MSELSELVFLKEPQRRLLLSIALAVFAGILLLSLLGGIAPGSRAVPGWGSPVASGTGNLPDMGRDMAAALESALATVEGVGAVRVQVALATAGDREFAIDTSGLRREGGSEIRGVLVVAAGADRPGVRAVLTRAVGAALDVPLHRVVVLPGKPDPEGGVNKP